MIASDTQKHDLAHKNHIIKSRQYTFKEIQRFSSLRLSKHFTMRDFLYSNVAEAYNLSNLPDDFNKAIYTGTKLCGKILEPLIETCGPILLGSGYRSPTVNTVMQTQGLGRAEYTGHKFIAEFNTNTALVGGTIGFDAIVTPDTREEEFTARVQINLNCNPTPAYLHWSKNTVWKPK